MKAFVEKYAPWALVVALMLAGFVGFFFTDKFLEFMGGDAGYYADLFFVGLVTAGFLVGAYVRGYEQMVPLSLVVASGLALFVMATSFQGLWWSVPIVGAAVILWRFAPRLFS